MSTSAAHPSILILVLHLGSWPEWFPLFLETCRWNSTVDWLIVTDCGAPETLPANVRLHQASLPGITRQIAAKLGYNVRIDVPYKLCDLRLAFPLIFDDVTGGYDFLGWGDLDVLYGDIRRLLSRDALEHDVITFYEQHLSGHLTIVRNIAAIRQLHLEVPDWETRVRRPEFQHLDEPAPDLLRGRFSVWAKQSYNTPLSPYAPWRDGTFNFPKEWYWHQGRLTNDIDGDTEFLYLHFMHWKGGPWPRECGNAHWERLDRIVHFDPALARHGFRINDRGFFPLDATGEDQSRPTGRIQAAPNPVVPRQGRAYAVTALTWTGSDVDEVEIRIGGPDGPLFARGGRSGTATTGEWVSDWMTFFLQDVSEGRPLTIAHTLGSVCVRVSRTIHAPTSDDQWRGERERLERLPRYEPTTTTLLGQPFDIVDAASFLTMYDEIIEQGIYGFESSEDRPYIIDCGANVGVSVCYFKQLYPRCRIVAFEPDGRAFDALARNAVTQEWTDVTLVKKAIFGCESELPFVSEGSWASRLARVGEERTGIVEAVRLRSYINERVELLKLDIEGAETNVLADCADLFHRIDRIVVEFHSFASEPQTLDRVLALLTTAGYRVYVRSVSTEWPLQPFRQRPVHLGMDMQLYIYAFKTPSPV